MKIIYYIITIFTCFITFSAPAQILDENNKLELQLSDSTLVTLFPARDMATKDRSFYYYWPINMRIPEVDSQAQFSFLAYDSNDDKEVDGAVMHLLLTWGLTTLQQAEAERLLQAKTDSSSWIMGAVPLSGMPEDFAILGTSCLANMMRVNVKGKSKAPLFPSQKLAISMLFSATEARALQTLITEKEALESVQLEFRFQYRQARSLFPVTLNKNLYELLNQTHVPWTEYH